MSGELCYCEMCGRGFLGRTERRIGDADRSGGDYELTDRQEFIARLWGHLTLRAS